MSVGPGFCGSMNLCRRLFAEATPCSSVYQTLESTLSKDQERFNLNWNFPLLNNVEFKARMPLTTTQTFVKENSSKQNWQIASKLPQFYTNVPRKLKAHRRFPATVSQKTHHMQMTQLPITTRWNNFDFQQILSLDEPCTAVEDDQKMKSYRLTCIDTSTHLLEDQMPNYFSTPVKTIYKIPHKPIFISPCPSTKTADEVIHSDKSMNRFNELQTKNKQHNSIFIKNMPRYSEQIVKRKSGAKVTGKNNNLVLLIYKITYSIKKY